MLRDMTAQEYTGWRKFAEHEPLTGQRLDILVALLRLTILATAPRKKGSRLPKLTDLVPKWWKDQRPEAAPEKMLAVAAGVTRSMGGTVPASVEEAIRGNRDGQDDGNAGAGC